jgi:hypothetical protein
MSIEINRVELGKKKSLISNLKVLSNGKGFCFKTPDTP